MILKLFMGGIFPYLYSIYKIYVCILTLEFNFIVIYLFLLGFGAQQRRLLLWMQFDLHLGIINYLLIIMRQKLQKLHQSIAPIWALFLVCPLRRKNYRYNFSPCRHHFCINPLVLILTFNFGICRFWDHFMPCCTQYPHPP